MTAFNRQKFEHKNGLREKVESESGQADRRALSEKNDFSRAAIQRIGNANGNLRARTKISRPPRRHGLGNDRIVRGEGYRIGFSCDFFGLKF